ncbi:hypothetical protein BgiMline_032778 [Biomphalaria glabrata]
MNSISLVVFAAAVIYGVSAITCPRCTNENDWTTCTDTHTCNGNDDTCQLVVENDGTRHKLAYHCTQSQLSPNVKGELDLGPATLSCRNITSYTNTKQLIDIAAMGEDGPPVGRSVTHVGESPSELEAYRQNTIVSTGAITTIVTTVNNTRLSTVISLYMVTATSAVTLLLLAELRERDSLTP